MSISSRELWVVLRARDEASRILRSFSGNMGTLDKQSEAIANQMRARGQSMIVVGTALAAAGGIAVGVLNDMTNAAIEYTRQAAMTLTQTDGIVTSVEELKNIGRTVAREIPVPFEQMQSSLYDIFSSMDVGVADAQILLREFSRAAVAGQVDLQTAGRATIAVLNAYKLPVTEVTRVNDIMFQLVRKGVGTYEEFTKTIGRAIPASVRAGQSFETLAGMMAFLTRNGLSTAMAATSSARALEAMANPRTITRLNEMGIATSDANGQFRPMVDILRDMNGQFATLTAPERAAALQNLFKSSGGTIQARRFFDVVFTNFDEFEQRVRDMENSAGVLDEAYNIMFNQPQAQIQLMTNKYEAMRTEIGDKLLPVKMKLVEIITDLLDGWNNLSPAMQSVIAYGAGIAAVLTTLAGVIFIVGGALTMLNAHFIGTNVGVLGLLGSLRAYIVNAALVAVQSIATGTAVQTMGRKLRTASLNMNNAQKGTMAFAAALSGMYLGKQIANAITGQEELSITSETLGRKLDSLSRGADAYGALFGDMLDRLSDDYKDFGSTVTQVANASSFDNLLDNMGLDATGLSEARDRFKEIDQALADMIRSGNVDGAEDAFARLAAQARAQGAEMEDIVKLFPQYKDALSNVDAEQDAANELQERYAHLLDGTEESLDEVTKAIQAHLDMIADADAEFIDIFGAYDTMIQKNQDAAQAAADATEDTEDSWEDFINNFPATVQGYLDEMQKMVDSQNNWEANMLVLSGRVSQALLDELTRMGAEGAPLVAQLVTASDEELARMEELFGQRSTEATQAFANTMSDPQVIALMKYVSANLGTQAANEIATKLANGTATVEQIMHDYELEIEGIKPTIRVDTTQAAIDLRNFVNGNQGMKIYVDAVGRTTGFSTGRNNYKGRSTGGVVYGPGTATSDSIPAMLSNGEFIVKAAAVSKYGLAMMYSINAERFANGGLAANRPVVMGAGMNPVAGVEPYTKQIDVKVDVHTQEIDPIVHSEQLGWRIATRVAEL